MQKLAVMKFPGEEDAWRAEFFDALKQLDRHMLQQRVDDLMKKQADGSIAQVEKDQLRSLLAQKSTP